MKLHARMYNEGQLVKSMNVEHKSKLKINLANPIANVTGYLLASECDRIWFLSAFSQSILDSSIYTIDDDSVLSIKISPQYYNIEITEIPNKRYIRTHCKVL